jgi:L-asparagine oxygenase
MLGKRTDSRIPRISVTRYDYLELLKIVQRLPSPVVGDWTEFCLLAEASAPLVPPRLASALRCFSERGNEVGALLLAMPMGQCDELAGAADRIEILAKLQGLINSVIGFVVAYETQASENFFQYLGPDRTQARLQTSLGYEVNLEVHSEQSFSTLRPDYVSLACVRGDSAAKTFISTAKQLAHHFGSDVQLLREAQWMHEIDASFRAWKDQLLLGVLRGPMAILEGGGQDPIIRFDAVLMRGLTERAQQLLRAVVNAHNAHRYECALSAGDILLIDNQHALHGRSSYKPRFDGSDRLLLRSFVMKELGKSAYARRPESRVILHKYS